MSTKWLYHFSEVDEATKHCGGSWDKTRALLGGKGANLGRMTALGLPVPEGFTLTTEACLRFQREQDLPAEAWAQVREALAAVEASTGKKFGARDDPLLFSCRSGAKISMPGMMDTLLNAGLNDANVDRFGELTSPRFAYDSYRRLIQGFGAITLGLPDEAFEKPLAAAKRAKGYASDVEMTAGDWRELSDAFKGVIRAAGKEFPQDPWTQLHDSVGAVFGSWNSARAVAYRNKTGISHSLGTACNIQRMVFGNKGDTSGTGVCFTRSPITGERRLFGDFLANAQGEDVVAGLRNCTPVDGMPAEGFGAAHETLLECCATLEKNLRNMQDCEFTVEEGRLFMLQTRDGKRTARAQVRIALEMVEEGLVSRDEAIMRVSGDDVTTLLLPGLDAAAVAAADKDGSRLTKGVNASPGGAVGQIVFSAARAEALQQAGDGDDKAGAEGGLILVRPFTKPEDVPGFFASKGVLTAEGGATSHAAVVARQFGVPCVVGAKELAIDLEAGTVTVAGRTFREGDWISLDATSGAVYAGRLPMVEADFEREVGLRTLLGWADEAAARAEVARAPGGLAVRGLEVWANADSGADAERAVRFGARGIGLCRTEHQFFAPERLPVVQEMIMASTDEERQRALDRLLPMQRSDFYDLFRAMAGRPVTIRLLDPPLHEFMPTYKDLLREVAELRADARDAATLRDKEALLARVEALHESNPMLGLRGVRLGIVFPAITVMQVRAIAEAACRAAKEGVEVRPKIMIPLTSTALELDEVRPHCEAVVAAVCDEQGVRVPHQFGTMVETPRAALTAGHMAASAEFFSFGSNDLTQMSYGISRDDAEREFLIEYVTRRILPANPFQVLDERGVGRLVKMATAEGRAVRPSLSVGLCGEHGGEGRSIDVCHRAGLDYVSCSPFRVPSARLSAAHAQIRAERAAAGQVE